MSMTDYAKTMQSNFEMRREIERMFTVLKQRSSAEATVVLQRLTNIQRQTSVARNVG
jgi:hypothetical protein